ncbi:MAG TPA: EAL domain-containing protein, partial [Burkholderiaceae bacterium]|nr:EAL domain-containing protein [Burkholderiaceae bacterium]
MRPATHLPSASDPPLRDATTLDDELLAWRSQLVDLVLKIGLLVGVVLASMATLAAHGRQDWGSALVSWGAFFGGGVLTLQSRLPLRWKAGVAVAIIWGVGVWLLSRAAASSLIYLLASPVMVALMGSTMPAIGVLLCSTVTVVLVGWWGDIPLNVIGGTPNGSILRWMNLSSNVLFLGLMLILSVRFLMHRLESALLAQRRAAVSLRQGEELLRQIAGQVPGMVYRLRLDAGGRLHFLYASPGAHGLFGLEPQALLADGLRLAERVHPEDRGRVLALLTGASTGAPSCNLEFRVEAADGAERWIRIENNEVGRDDQGVVHNGIMVDVTERKLAEAQVWHQAHHDLLTGLPNRRWLHERLAQALRLCLPELGQKVALMLIDLDHFKDVNDTLGHGSGDALLVEAARRLRESLRATDTLGRMGGDEFALVLPLCTGVAEVGSVAERLLQVLGQPYQLDGERVHVGASIGVAIYPDDADSVEVLLQDADQALYRAKDEGRHRLCHFTPELQQRNQDRARLAAELREALPRGELHLVYQPIVELATGRVRKAEALLRWTHPERGPVGPAEFIPVAESTGLIGEIGDWVFLEAARQAQRWRAQVDPGFQISVNRSPLQFRRGGLPELPWPDRLAALGLPGDAVAVEITEGLLLEHDEGVSLQLQALRDCGMSLSLDDFGTGYSALGYLNRFSIDVIKIDRSFVSGVGSAKTGQSLCRAIVRMAHELGMRVVAEGVETRGQRDWLREVGCDFAQGYYFARP